MLLSHLLLLSFAAALSLQSALPSAAAADLGSGTGGTVGAASLHTGRCVGHGKGAHTDIIQRLATLPVQLCKFCHSCATSALRTCALPAHCIMAPYRPQPPAPPGKGVGGVCEQLTAQYHWAQGQSPYTRSKPARTTLCQIPPGQSVSTHILAIPWVGTSTAFPCSGVANPCPVPQHRHASSPSLLVPPPARPCALHANLRVEARLSLVVLLMHRRVLLRCAHLPSRPVEKFHQGRKQTGAQQGLRHTVP